MNGYDIREDEGFLPETPSFIAAFMRWDEMRSGLDWALNRNPMHPSFARHLNSFNLWAAEILGPPWVCVFYEVDELKRVVTYKRLIFDPAVLQE